MRTISYSNPNTSTRDQQLIIDYLSFVCISDYRHITYIGKTKFTREYDASLIPEFIVGYGCAVRSNWCGKSDRSQGNARFTFEWDGDLNNQKIAQEQQWNWWLQAGIPLSLPPLDTGNKSLHFTLVSETPLDDFTWGAIANGIYNRIAEVSKGVAEPDRKSLVVDQAWRIPGYEHDKTGVKATLRTDLWDKPWQPIPLEILKSFADPDYQEVAVSRRHRKVGVVSVQTMEELTKLIEDFKADFSAIGDTRTKQLMTTVEKKMRTIVRGQDAETKVFALSDYFSPVTTRLGADASIAFFMEQLEKQLTPQDVNRGYAWDRESYKRQVIRGLSAGLNNFRDKYTAGDREVIGEKVDKKYISELGLENLSNKIVCVKSATGTGKTKAIVDLLKNHTRYPRILIISHRVSLIQQWLSEDNSNNLGFQTYDDPILKRHTFNLSNVDRLLITVDSLGLLKRDRKSAMVGYDLVILDEVDQAFSHLFIGNTEVKKDRLRILHILRAVLTGAKQIVSTSAHLSSQEVEIISRLSGSEDKAIWVNEHSPHQKTFVELPSEKAAMTKVEELLNAGKKVFVACETKLDAEAIAKQLTQKFLGKAGWLLTGGNKEENKVYLQNLNKLVTSLDWLVVSPLLNTGFDISVAHFDSVVGLFTNADTLGIFDLEQFLNRVRYPKEDCYYYCVPVLNWADTRPEVISTRERIREKVIEDGFVALDPLTGEEVVTDVVAEWLYEWQELYLIRKADERIARSPKLRQTLSLRGHVVKRDDQAEATSKVSKAPVLEERVQKLYLAPVVDKETLDKWRDGTLTEEQEYSRQKYWACVFLGVEDLSVKQAQWWLKRGWKTRRILTLLEMTEEGARNADLAHANAIGQDRGRDQEFNVSNRKALLAIQSALDHVISAGQYTAASLLADDNLMAAIRDYSVQLSHLGIVVSFKTPGKTVADLLESLLYTVNEKLIGAKRQRTYFISRTPEQQAMVDRMNAIDPYEGII